MMHLKATKTSLYKLVNDSFPGIFPPCKYCDFTKARGAYNYWLRGYDVSAYFAPVAGVPMLLVTLDGGGAVTRSVHLDLRDLRMRDMVVIS